MVPNQLHVDAEDERPSDIPNLRPYELAQSPLEEVLITKVGSRGQDGSNTHYPRCAVGK